MYVFTNETIKSVVVGHTKLLNYVLNFPRVLTILDNNLSEKNHGCKPDWLREFKQRPVSMTTCNVCV
jgi:hypothetical protein